MFKFKVPIVLLVAIILQLIIIYKPITRIYDPELESAIRRAKTASCKREFEEFATRISRELEESSSILKRLCKLDSDKNRIQKVGCASNSTRGLIKIDEYVGNSTTCLELCFTFGHSFAGFGGPSSKCFCGDGDEHNPENSDRHLNCQENADFDWFQVDYGIYNHRKAKSNHILNIENNPARRDNCNNPIRIAFLLILNGRTTPQVRRLLKSIYSRRHVYYLHVDSRDDHLYNDLLFLEREYENIIIAKSRFTTIWGGPALLRMMIDAMKQLIHFQWDYLINLSASDFPIRPLSELEAYLQSDDKKMIYLKSHNIKGYNFIKKQGLDSNFYQCEDRVWRLGKRQLPKGIVFYGGSDWYALPRDFCSYILYHNGEHRGLVKSLLQIFNYTLLPAESFFHTLALNSEFCDRFADANLRLTNWKRKGNCKCQHRDVVDWCGCSPVIYRETDWFDLEKASLPSNKLFFSRKFDPTVSLTIINKVEKKLLNHKNSDQNHVDWESSYWRNIHYKDNSSETKSRLSFLAQFGKLSLSQAIRPQSSFIADLDYSTEYKLESIHEYFNQDKFIGLIYNYCDKIVCVQLLVERNIDAHVKIEHGHCLDPGRQRLIAIEINQGFDPGERMFREYQPLHPHSDIVVYSEWIVAPSQHGTPGVNNESENVLFNWINPEGMLELKQTVKIKSSQEETKYRLGQRLKISKPLMFGLWTLKISSGDKKTCLNYRFLVFKDEFERGVEIEQDSYDEHYSVTKMCFHERNGKIISGKLSSKIDNCSNQTWSLMNQKTYKM